MANGEKPDLKLLPPVISHVNSRLRGDTSWLANNTIRDPLNNNASLIAIPSAMGVTFPNNADVHIRWAISMFNNDGAAAGLFDANDPRTRALFFSMGGNPFMNMLLFNPDINSRLQEMVVQFARAYFGAGAENYPEVLLAMSYWFQQMGASGGGTVNVYGIPVQGRTATVATAAGMISAAVPNMFSVLGHVAQMMALKSSGGGGEGPSAEALYNIFAAVVSQESFKDKVEQAKGGGVTWKEFTDALGTIGGRPVPSLEVVRIVGNGAKSTAWTPAEGVPALNERLGNPANTEVMGTNFHVRYGGLRAFVQGVLIALSHPVYFDGVQRKFKSPRAEELYRAIVDGKDGWLMNELGDNVTATS